MHDITPETYRTYTEHLATTGTGIDRGTRGLSRVGAARASALNGAHLLSGGLGPGLLAFQHLKIKTKERDLSDHTYHHHRHHASARAPSQQAR